MSLWSFQGPRGLERPVLQNSTAYVVRQFGSQPRGGCLHKAGIVEVDVVPGEPVVRTTEVIKRDRRLPEYKSSGIPRKEVIQPQLPLRLPCYDFTPIIDPTFDGSLPCGLGHRLRVLPTFVM